MLAMAVRWVNAGAHCQSVTDEHCARIGGFVTHLPAGGLHAAVSELCPRMTKPACACLQVKRSTVTPWWWGLRTFIKYRCERRRGMWGLAGGIDTSLGVVAGGGLSASAHVGPSFVPRHCGKCMRSLA